MKDEQPPAHQLEHAEPTLIHPDEDMTILARWLRRGMEQGAQFWLLAAGGVAALVAVTVIASGLAAGKSTSSEAWTQLTQAKTVEERLKIADDHPNTPVANWARLMSAQEEYANGINDLTTPGKKDVAGPRLTKALGLFRQVAKDAPKDSSQALGGMFGAARALEARNELPEAIEQYRLVAAKFPNTPEGRQSLALARALEEPVNANFYKELYAYKPSTAPAAGLDLPGSAIPPPSSPGAAPGFNLKSFLPDFNKSAPAGLDAPPPSTPPVAAPDTPPPPLDPPKAAAAPKAEPPRVEVPGVEPPKAEPPSAPTPPIEVPKAATPPK